MRKLSAIVLFTAICITAWAAGTGKGFKMTSLNIGYMPQEELGRRVSVEDLTAYIKKQEAICSDFFADSTNPENLDIVVAIRPDQKSRVWFVSSLASTPSGQRDKLRARLERVPTPKVLRGPVAFAMLGEIAGGDPKAAKKPGPPPVPGEWKQALSKQTQPAGFDYVLSQVWPGTTVATPVDTPPSGFINQILEPTGGHMLRPKDWFYKEDHHDSVLTWMLSREDTSKGHAYTTGVRIEAFIGVQKNQGKSAKQFILDFVESKKKDASKIVKTCSPEDQGPFTRQCLEIEQGPRHILYSLFWGNSGLDMAVIMTSESTNELWESFSRTFGRMNSFELIDMTRFQSNDAFKVPPGVNYKEAPAELNEQGRQQLASKFSPKAGDKNVLSLFQDKLICGPGLWRELKDDESLSKLAKGKVAIHVDGQTLDGKLFQTPDEVLLFWKAFTKRTNPGDFKIRKLNENELRIFWTIISFDIEEPIFILESEKQKILVDLGPGKPPRILWIDDLDKIQLKGK